MSSLTFVKLSHANAWQLCLFFLALSGTTLANSILAFAPVTALTNLNGLNIRQFAGACPASSQTACADGLGCCPKGAACTYSAEVPVCDESCNGGPSCPNGGCCQVGYVCGTTNNFCTPAPTPTQTSLPAPPALGGKNETDPKKGSDNSHDVADGITVTTRTSIIATITSASATPSAPLHIEPGLGRDKNGNKNSVPVGDGLSPSSSRALTPAKTSTPTGGSSHPNTSSTSSTTSTTGYVAGNVPNTKTTVASAQATNIGAASINEAPDSLMTFVLGWIAGLALLL